MRGDRFQLDAGHSVKERRTENRATDSAILTLKNRYSTGSISAIEFLKRISNNLAGKLKA